MNGVSSFSSSVNHLHSITQTEHSIVPLSMSHGRAFYPSYFNHKRSKSVAAGELSRIKVLCRSSPSPGGPSSGENESRNVLDAFFLGKALAEAVNARIETTVGEVLSTIGRLQAEQQKQVQDFQEEVLERAKKAKEKAAREALEAKGFIPKSGTTVVASTAPNDTSLVTTSPSAAASSTPKSPSTNRNDEDSVLGVSNEN